MKDLISHFINKIKQNNTEKNLLLLTAHTLA